MTDIFDELQWRGLVAQTTDEPALREALADGPITLYCGFDPTAPSLHFGNKRSCNEYSTQYLLGSAVPSLHRGKIFIAPWDFVIGVPRCRV